MKLNTAIIISALMIAPQVGSATQIVRQASARIVVFKNTMKMVNGKYTSTEAKICENIKQFPVTDERLAGTVPLPTDLSDVCESTVENKPVLVVTTPLASLSESNSVPWKPGQTIGIKLFGVISYVYAKDQTNAPAKLQESLSSYTFTEDLKLKELGFSLTPNIEFKQGACTIEKGAGSPKADCEPKESVNLEESFNVYVYIEDKNF